MGLFGINSGTLKNIGLEGTQIATSAATSYIGSIAGRNNGLINACYVKTPLVNVNPMYSYGGGLVGQNNSGGTIAQSYSLGGSIIPGSYSHIGGLVGDHGGILSNCYSTSAVGSGDGNEGSLTATGAGNVYGCHYDRETAGLEAGKMAYLRLPPE